MSEYRHLKTKKARKPVYLQDPPKEPDLCIGFLKLIVEVHVELLVRLKSLYKT